MKATTRFAAFFAALMLVGGLFCEHTLAQARSEVVPPPHYIYDGKPIVLSPSTSYGAFKIDPADLTDFRGLVRQIDSLAIEQSQITEKRGIVLVRRTGESSESEFSDGLAELDAGNDSYPVFRGRTSEKVLINEFIVRFANDVADDEAAKILETVGAEIIRKSRLIPNQYIIRFPSADVLTALGRVNAMARSNDYRYATPNFILIQPKRRETPRLTSKIGPQLPEFQTLAATDPNPWPNDHHFGQQWGLYAIRAQEAWQLTTGSCDVSIAVIDDGIDLSHEDLEQRIGQGWDAIEEDSVPQHSQGDYHGTAVAGVASARTHNVLGVAGVTWGGEIIPIRIFDSTFYDSLENPGDLDPSAITTPEIVQAGVAKAVDLGADVLNLSWKADPSAAIGDVIEDAVVNQGRIVVAAVGEGTGDVEWPASLSTGIDLIAVGASVFQDELLPSSNFTEGVSAVTLIAPGDIITTTDPSGEFGQSDHEYSLTNFGDTSAAAPFASGAAALLLSWQPGASPAQVKGWLTSKAELFTSTAFPPEAYGAGLLDIKSSLDEIGTDGIDLDISLAPDTRLRDGETTVVRVVVKRDGALLSGATVTFESADSSLVEVTPDQRRIAANCEGAAEAVVTGASGSTSHNSTTITARVADKSASITVRTGGTSVWSRPIVWVALLLLVTLGIMMLKRNSPA